MFIVILTQLLRQPCHYPTHIYTLQYHNNITTSFNNDKLIYSERWHVVLDLVRSYCRLADTAYLLSLLVENIANMYNYINRFWYYFFTIPVCLLSTSSNCYEIWCWFWLTFYGSSRFAQKAPNFTLPTYF